MFGFGKSNSAVNDEKSASLSAEKISFHDDLIDKLILDQSQIYSDFKELVTALKEGNHKEIETTLITFKRGFHSFLIEKNVKLYSYLKHSAELFPKETLQVNNSRVINTQLSRKVNRFIDHYLDDGKLVLDTDQHKTFENELKEIGTEMVQCMRDERENLFPIYQQKQS